MHASIKLSLVFACLALVASCGLLNSGKTKAALANQQATYQSMQTLQTTQSNVYRLALLTHAWVDQQRDNTSDKQEAQEVLHALNENIEAITTDSLLHRGKELSDAVAEFTTITEEIFTTLNSFEAYEDPMLVFTVQDMMDMHGSWTQRKEATLAVLESFIELEKAEANLQWKELELLTSR